MGKRLPGWWLSAPRGAFIAAMLGALWVQAACGSESRTVTSPTADKCAVQAGAEQSAFPSSGGSGTLRITANRECAWSVQSEAGWIAVAAPASGHGEGAVPFTVATNGDPAARNTELIVNDRRVSLSQEGTPCVFRLSSTHELFDPAGGERTIDVVASSNQCEWKAAADESWITIVRGREGRASGAVTFQVEAISGASRSGTLTIAGQPVRVEQGACSFAVSPVTITIGAAGGTAEVRVPAPSGCTWTAESHTPWIAIASSAAGSGPGLVSVRVDATSGPPRTGRLTIAGSTVTVTQNAGCSIAVDREGFAAPIAGGRTTLSVDTAAGCAWSASSAAPWMSIVSGAEGSGPGRVDVSILANTGPSRTGTLAIGGRTITVTQGNGCAYVLTPSSVDAGGEGGTSSIAVATAAECTWRTSSALPWVAMPAGPFSGPGAVQLTMPPNTTPPRAGTVTIAGQPLPVRQGSRCTFGINPPSSSYDANGGGGAVLVFVNGPCTWTAQSTADWIGVDPAQSAGTGEGLVLFTIAANPGAGRTGTISIAGQVHTVTQNGR